MEMPANARKTWNETPGYINVVREVKIDVCFWRGRVGDLQRGPKTVGFLSPITGRSSGWRSGKQEINLGDLNATCNKDGRLCNGCQCSVMFGKGKVEVGTLAAVGQSNNIESRRRSTMKNVAVESLKCS
jgi:hypothetical protein